MRRLRVYATEAIPLKRMDYGEADRLLTMLTPLHGKVRALAKGVRRPTSRMAGHLELFAHAHLMLAVGRELDVVTQATTIEPFRRVREELVRASLAYHLAELVDHFLPDRDPHPDVFSLLCAALRCLNEDAIPPQLVARHFEVHLLDAVGFRPQVMTCLACHAALQPEANQYSTSLGGALCPQCGSREPSAVPIAVGTLKLLRYLQRTGPVAALSVRPPAAVAHDAARVLRRQLECALERRLWAADFVQRVAEAAAGYRA